jgi:hypothetical protein
MVAVVAVDVVDVIVNIDVVVAANIDVVAVVFVDNDCMVLDVVAVYPASYIHYLHSDFA